MYDSIPSFDAVLDELRRLPPGERWAALRRAQEWAAWLPALAMETGCVGTVDRAIRLSGQIDGFVDGLVLGRGSLNRI